VHPTPVVTRTFGRKKKLTNICQPTLRHQRPKSFFGDQPHAAVDVWVGKEEKITHTPTHISLVINIYFTFCRTNSARSDFCFDFVHGQLWSCGKVHHAEVKEICRPTPLITRNRFFYEGRPSSAVVLASGSKKKTFHPPHHLSMDFHHQRQKKIFRGQPSPTRPSGWVGKKKLFILHDDHHLSIDLHHQQPKKFFQRPTPPTRLATSRSMEKKRKG
jgi:hypothetical protein